MNEKLKSFIKESYAKVKKGKKSPKNFNVRKNINDEFYLAASTVGVPNGCTDLGNLDVLHKGLSDQVVEALVEKVQLSSYISAIDPIKAKGNYSVYLSNCNGNKLAVLKEVKIATGLGLKETKELIDSAPTIVLSNVDQATATYLVSQITKAGGTSKVSQDIQDHITTQTYVTNEGSRVFVRIYDKFSLSWIPFIQAALATIFAAQPWVYDELDSEYQQFISKAEFDNLVNYSLNK